MRICTIVARNYLAYARVLAESFLAQHPAGECNVLVIDDRAGEVKDTSEPFRVLRPNDLSIERFEGMAAMYDVTELATAVKPWLLEHLLAEQDTPVSYFDPDIRFYAPVDEINELAVEHELVLIPHITAPIPDDGEQPDELSLMASGTYNLGFVGMAPTARVRQLLGWWQKRLRYDCVIDHALGYFVDQRWFDLVPSMFDRTSVLRDPGVNVAYWNLHERTLSRSPDGSWLVNGTPLRFFHFSGFDPDNPELLSRHQTRTRLSDRPELAQLCRDYARDVRADRRAGDQDGTYPWDTLGDGRQLSRRLRRLYREGERESAFNRSPFEVDGGDEFLAWLNEPAPGDPAPLPVSRFWFDVYKERKDLQVVFPKLIDEVEAFNRWIEGFGEEMGDVRGLTPSGNDDQTHGESETPAEASDGDEPWGVNVAGFLQSELGIGEAARGLIAGLDAARIPVLPVHGVWRPSSRQAHSYAMVATDDAAFPMNIVCVNADVLEQWAADAGESFFSGRYTIGFWWWEVLAFPPQWLPSFDLVDEVWVASQFVADAISPVSSVPVTKVTLPVSPPSVIPRSRSELGLPEDFLFLFLFDHHSIFDRKNPLGAIEAFKHAFRPGSGAKLVIKSINHEHHVDEHEKLLLCAREHPDIQVIDRYVDANAKNAMIASADCYVSLHRGEGFGLTMAEALCMGKPVIATRYGGNLEFMTDRNSWLVDYRLTPIGPGRQPYPEEGEWADPDLDQASNHMREIFRRSSSALVRAQQGVADMRERHSPQAAASSMQRRLEHVYARRSRWPRRVARSPTMPDSMRLAELIAEGPQGRSSAGSPARLLRRLVLRVIKPFTAFQNTVNSELLNVLRDTAQSTTQVATEARDERLRTARRTAAQLAELRRQAASIEEMPGRLLRTDQPAHSEATTIESTSNHEDSAEQVTDLLTGLGG